MLSRFKSLIRRSVVGNGLALTAVVQDQICQGYWESIRQYVRDCSGSGFIAMNLMGQSTSGLLEALRSSSLVVPPRAPA